MGGKWNSRVGVRESTIWRGQKFQIVAIWLEVTVEEEIIEISEKKDDYE